MYQKFEHTKDASNGRLHRNLKSTDWGTQTHKNAGDAEGYAVPEIVHCIDSAPRVC